MKVTIYTECPTKDYFNALYHLKDINIELIDSRFLRSLLVKILKRKDSWKNIWKSFIAPFTLPFKDNIIISFAPYHSRIFYIILLKILKKRMIYHTSWPYWKDKYVHKPFLFSKKLWMNFLNKMPTIAVSAKAELELNNLGAKAVQIPHGIDTEIFKDLKIKKDKFTVLFVGRLVEEKGIRDLLELSKELSNINFVFAGSGPLEKEINKYPVKYLGFIKDKKRLASVYNQADLFVLNSYKTNNWEELYGIVLLEAMSCGLPVIATDCVGPKEIIQNQKTGILIPQKDKTALKKAILDLKENKSKREKLSSNAKQFVVKNYNIGRISNKWFNLLNSVFKK